MIEALKNMARMLGSVFTPVENPLPPSRNLKEAITRLDNTTSLIRDDVRERTNSEVLLQMLERIP
jgi:hypothetical protein